MHLVDDWRTIAHRAWSMRLWLLAVVCGMATELLPLLPYLDGVISPGVLKWLSIVLGLLGIVARLVGQPTLHAPAEPVDSSWLIADFPETRPPTPPGGFPAP